MKELERYDLNHLPVNYRDVFIKSSKNNNRADKQNRITFLILLFSTVGLLVLILWYILG